MAIFSEFPEQEFHARYEMLVAAGAARGVDAFVFTDEHNLRYFAGGPLTDAFLFRTDYMAVVIPTDTAKEPALILSESRWNATGPSWIPRTRLWPGGIDAAEGNVTVDAIVDEIRQQGLADGTVAMEIEANEKLFMPVMTYQQLRAALPGMRVVSGYDVVMAVKAVKSPLEIEKLRRACRISNDAIEHGLSIIREGITEKDVARAIKAKMFELGADSVPFLTVIAGWEGRSICWDSHATGYRVKRGDPIQVDGGAAVDGYTADMVRTASLGPIPNDRYLAMYEASMKAQDEVRRSLRAGAKIRDVCTAGRDCLINAGYEDLLVFGEGQTGHGIGLNLHEAPFLHRGSEESLEAGMVIAVEPALLEKPEMKQSTYFTIVENNYVITADGYEQLTASPDEIRVV